MTELERCEFAKSKGYTYNHLTGELKGIYGKVITMIDAEGYVACQLYINKKRHIIKAHRLAWFLYHGELPSNQVDHKDGIKTNNKIDNLRDVTNHQNQWNKTSVKGYTWDKNAKKFHARIHINYKEIHLGRFNTEQEARSAYLEAKKKYHVI
jgi:HNH endonuclease/AP2 domain